MVCAIISHEAKTNCLMQLKINKNQTKPKANHFILLCGGIFHAQSLWYLKPWPSKMGGVMCVEVFCVALAG